MRISTRLGIAALAAVALTATACGVENGPTPTWSASWSAAPQRASAGFGPSWSESGFSNQTLRQVVRLNSGGDGLRIRLSN